MKLLRYQVIVVFIFLLVGCSSKTISGLDNYQGSSEAKLMKINSNSYQLLSAVKNSDNKCFQDGDKLELWLDDINYNQLFEGSIEKLLDGNNLNEIALILSLYKRNIGENEEKVIKENIILQFKDGIAINVSPNSDDKFIQAFTIQKNQDIKIKIEVIEYDERTKEMLEKANDTFKLSLNKLKILSSSVSSVLTDNLIKELLEGTMSSLINKFSRNDLILKHETILHSCNTIPNENTLGERYLAEGTLSIVRMPSEIDTAKKWKSLSKIPDHSSFVKLRLVKRQAN